MPNLKLKPKGGWRASFARLTSGVTGSPSSTTPSSPQPSSIMPSSSPPPPIILSPPASSMPELPLQAPRSPAPPSPRPSVLGLLLPAPNLLAPSSSPPSPLGESGSPPSGGSALSGLHTLLGIFDRGTAAFPPLQSAIRAVVSGIEKFEKSGKNTKEFEDLTLKLTTLGEVMNERLQEPNSAPVSELLTRTMESIREQAGIIAEQQKQNYFSRIEKSQEDEDTLAACHQKIQDVFQRHQIDAEKIIFSTLAEQQANAEFDREKVELEMRKAEADRENAILDRQMAELDRKQAEIDRQKAELERKSIQETNQLSRLDPADLGTYNSSLAFDINRRACTTNTRTGVLSDLNDWLGDPEAPNVCWMNGMAGTGKTTIAYTFAEALEKQKRLAASFFCTRTSDECQNVKRIVPTIAYQLATRSAIFRSALCRAIGDTLRPTSLSIPDQFKRLLKEPLLALEVRDALPKDLVIIIDALDECKAQNGVEQVLEMLLQAHDLPLKFFVTSRPEPIIQNKIQKQPKDSRSIFVLHHVKQSDVRTDIKLYLRAELPSVPNDKIEKLVDLAGSLFIFAATAVRYLRIGNFDERWERMLSVKSESNRKHAEIDELYTTILASAIDNQELEDPEKERIRLVLWTAVCAREPISVESLSTLAGIHDPKKASEALEPLLSVIHVSEDGGLVSTLHASFPDFMFDRTRSKNFFCDAEHHSQLISRQCFEVMKERLRFNICKLESSYIPDEKVPNLEERVNQSITPTLAYACRYWGDHLQLAANSDDLCALLQQFLSERLLFWMEVMNLKRWTGMGARAMLAVKLWLMANHPSLDLLRLTEDARGFVATFAANPVSQCTPHLYVSALPFCERSSAVFNHYWSRMRGLIEPKGTGAERRDTTKLASWKVDSEVQSVAYSRDGTQIVIGCGNGSVIVKDAYDGSLIASSLEGHTRQVTSVAFSPDGTRIVSGSSDRTIRVWNAQDGTPVGAPFEGHTGEVMSVAFSPDGTRIVSGSFDRTIRVWNAQDGTPVGAPFEGHTGEVMSVAFSPDGTRIVSGSSDRTIRVWNAQDGTPVGAPFEGHTGEVRSVAFSPDGTRIVSGSFDRTIRVWNAQDGTPVGAPFEGHTGWVMSVAFSPDGTRIVSGSYDRTIRVWNAQDGTPVGAPFEGHASDVNSVALSLDGTRVVSGSDDNTIRTYNLHSNPTITDSWVLANGGWVLGQDSRLLFWAPDDFISYLPSPYNAFVIGPNGFVSIDYNNIFLGEKWHLCYSPDQTGPY